MCQPVIETVIRDSTDSRADFPRVLRDELESLEHPPDELSEIERQFPDIHRSGDRSVDGTSPPNGAGDRLNALASDYHSLSVDRKQTLHHRPPCISSGINGQSLVAYRSDRCDHRFPAPLAFAEAASRVDMAIGGCAPDHNPPLPSLDFTSIDRLRP